MTASVYTPHVDSALPDGWSLTRPLPDEFFGLSPAQLENERGRYLLMQDEVPTEEDRAICQHKLDEIERRAKRLHQLGGRWPNRRRTNDLVQLARDLKRAVPLEDFIAHQVLNTQLVRTGDRWKGICPLHDERTPSFYVFPDGGWHCFGKCDRGGDIYTLIALVFGLPNFPDQVALLADYYGRGMA